MNRGFYSFRYPFACLCRGALFRHSLDLLCVHLLMCRRMGEAQQIALTNLVKEIYHKTISNYEKLNICKKGCGSQEADYF